MMRLIALVLAVMGQATALRGSGQKSELLTDMRPEVVSKLLSEVTDKWVMDFVSVKTNASDQATAYSNMEKSCLTVTKSIISGSDGDEDRVAEYMQEVCSRSSSKMCTSFAKGMDDAMIGDANFNRNTLKVTNFCKTFWNTDVKTAAEAEKNADEERAQAEKLRGSIRAKMENLTAAIEKTSSSVEKTYNSTEDNVQKLLLHAQKAMSLATKKEADALKKAQEEKEA